MAGNRDLRDSEKSRSQNLEGGQLGEKRVRSWHQTGYHLFQLDLRRFVAARPASRAADGEQVFMWQMPVPPQRERKGSMAATKAAGISSIGV